MSGKKTTEQAVVELVPAPAHLPKIDLRNASAIRRELAAVYRDARSGKIETQDATRLGYLLNMLGQAYERDVMEQRIEALEVTNDES